MDTVDAMTNEVKVVPEQESFFVEETNLELGLETMNKSLVDDVIIIIVSYSEHFALQGFL